MKYSAIILAVVAMVAAQAAPATGAAPKPKVIRAPCGTSCILPILKSSNCEASPPAPAGRWIDQTPAKAKSSPAQIAAVRECFCKAPGLQEAFAACVPAACAKTHGKTTTLVGRFNAMCAKTAGFKTIAIPAPVAAAPPS